MKRRLLTVFVLVLALAMAVGLSGCGKKDEAAEEPVDEIEQVVEGEAEDAEESEEPEEPEAEEPEEDLPSVVKTIEGVDENLGSLKPLQIETITLYEDGSVGIIPLDDLKKNEIKDEETEVVYPFEESGEVSDVTIIQYGDQGYRTILALMKDGTISVVNGRALVEDHIFAVLDNVGSRDNFVTVEQVDHEDGSAPTIVATTENGEEVILDYSLNFDDPEA